MNKLFVITSFKRLSWIILLLCALGFTTYKVKAQEQQPPTGTTTTTTTQNSSTSSQSNSEKEPTLTRDQKVLFPWLSLAKPCDAISATPGGGGISSDGSIYQSGLSPPYIYEQFIIHVLKAVAKKRNVPETNAITEAHIVTLMAFAYGEGGDIANKSTFNLWNTGINDPNLIDGAARADGLQAFKSFDAGVEATARTMVGSTQTRLADVLTDPNSNEAQFMDALTHFERYPGNKLWAEASVGNPQGYYDGRMKLVGQVRKSYDSIASLEIGTPEHELKLNRRHPQLLQFHFGGDAGTLQPGSTSIPSPDQCVAPTQQPTQSAQSGNIKHPDGFVDYLQIDPRWKDVPYAGKTLAEAGCGPTTLAMIISSIKQDPSITPLKILQDMEAAGLAPTTQSTAAFTTIPAKYGLKTTSYSVGQFDTALEQLKQRRGEVYMIANVNPGYWTQRGHYLLLTGVDADGKITVKDTIIRNPTLDTKTYDAAFFKTNGGSDATNAINFFLIGK